MKFSKIFVAFLCVMLVSPFAFFAQEASGDALTESETSSNVSQSESYLDKKESDLTFSSKDNTQTNNTNSVSKTNNNVSSPRVSNVWTFVKMVLVLAVVIACIYCVMYFMRKKMGIKSVDSDPFLRRVATISVGPGKTVQIVTLLEHAYLVGVSDSSVNLIGEVQDKELVDAMNLYADKQSKKTKARSFADVLEMFMPSKNVKRTSEENVYGESEKNFSDFMKEQRNKLTENEQENENPKNNQIEGGKEK